MNATVRVFAVEILCPKCDVEIAEPKTGSLFWSTSEETPPDEVQCPDCGQTLKVKLPRDTK